jgi:hypothetical protein
MSQRYQKRHAQQLQPFCTGSGVGRSLTAVDSRNPCLFGLVFCRNRPAILAIVRPQLQRPPGCATRPGQALPARMGPAFSPPGHVTGVARRQALTALRGQALMAMITAPVAIRPMPIHPVAEGRSPKNANAKSATSTTLNLSIGATIEAGPSLSARK